MRQHDGGFGGVIVASIDPDFIDRFFQSVDLGSHGAVTLHSLDGVILASRGTSGRAVGRQIVPQALREALTRGRTGHYWGGGAFDGVNRLVTFRVSTEYPLILSVGLADSDIVQSYQRNQTIYLTIAIIITLIVLIVIWIGIRHQIGLVRVRDDLRRSEAKARTKARDLELKSRELEVTLDNITHGLCMFDAEKRLVVCNDRYAKIYNLPAKLLQAGTSHEAI